jgi:hypothetical protein
MTHPHDCKYQPLTKEPYPTTTREIEVILWCINTHVDFATDKRIKELAQEGIDWGCVANKCLRLRAALLLFWNLDTRWPSIAPKAIMTQLRNYYILNSRRNLHLTRKLIYLLKLFEDHKIKAIPYKGPILSYAAYGNIGLRLFNDLDILVDASDFRMAKKLLLAHGYKSVNDSTHEECFLQAQLERDDGLVNIDLHYGIPPRHLNINCQILWDYLETISLEGNKIKVLIPEAQLLVTCIEGYKEPLQWFEKVCDIAALIRANQGMDWDQLVALSYKLRINQLEILYLGLSMAHDLLDAPVPEDILNKANGDPVKRLIVNKLSRQFLGEFYSTKNDSSFYSHLFDPLFYLGFLSLDHLQALGATERLSERVTYLLSCAIEPTATDRKSFPLPRYLSFLYYIVRPIRLIGKYGANLLSCSA